MTANPFRLAEEHFQNRVALVTGASSGIGSEIAVALGAAGSSIGINYCRNQSGGEAARDRVLAAGGKAVLLQADVSRADEVERMFSELAEAFGQRLDFLVNNAGEWMDKAPVADCPEEMWDRMFDINAKSVFLCCRAAAKKMIEQGEGAIVNIGSIAGHTGGGGGTVPYGAAKAAVHTFTRGLARELAGKGIRVNGVAPGVIDTPMIERRVSPEVREKLIGTTPLRRFGQPAEIAPIVMMLLSPASSYVTGQIVDANGGLLMR